MNNLPRDIAIPQGEPHPASFARRTAAKYFQATRPPFLLAAFVPCLIGLATAHFDGFAVTLVAALLCTTGAVLVHAGVNVLNDYYDALSGTDQQNTDRLFPFTGGSRFIQNGVLTERETAWFGSALLAGGALAGLLLLPQAGPGLLLVGAVGLLLGWAYSAPPLALNSRGWGELTVALGFGALIPLGCDLVQRGGFDPLPLLAGISYGLLGTALLYINQFPDRKADAAVGKHHWVVRLGPARARWGYLLLILAAYGWVAALVAAGLLPGWSLLALLPLPFSLLAARDLIRHAEEPSRLLPAIPFTIIALVAHGLLLSLGIWLAR